MAARSWAGEAGGALAPRWEFRVFGEDLAAERAALRRFPVPADEEEARTDIYFVVPRRIDASLKLRGERLDLKLLRDERDGLELWEPAGEADFPVAPGRLREQLLGPVGVRLVLPEAPVGRDLLLGLARAAPGMRLVRVEKRRRQHRLEGVVAEFTRLAADGQAVESVAVEGEDPERVKNAIAALGLSGRRNTSYQRWLVGALRLDPGRV